MKRLGHAATLAAAFLATSVGVALASEDGESPHAFRVEEAELDLGTVIAGKDATATFIFHNDGHEDVHIIRAKPS